LAVARSILDAERGAAEDEQADLREQRARWERSALPDVEAPAWRSPREATTGAPFWALIDPRPDAAPEEVDRLEAALTAAGLLDAWVQPDGAVILPDGRSDLVLTAAAGAVPGGTLADLLDPVPNAPVGGAVVAAVLAGVALVDTALPPAAALAVAVGRDGTFRLGSAVGRGPERPAAVLGAPARERNRRVRLAELDRLLAAAGERLDALARQADALDRRAAAARSELDAAPDGGAVRKAVRAAETAAVRLDDARSRVDDSLEALRRAEDDVRATLRALTSLSAQHGLPAEAAALDVVEGQLRALESAAGTWARRLREAQRAAVELRRAEERAAELDALAISAEADRAAAATEAAETAVRVAALDASVGADYREVLSRIEALATERSAGRTRVEEVRRRTPQLQRRVGELTRAVEDAGDARRRAEDEREAARRRLVAVTDDLLSDTGFAAPDTLDGVSAVLGFARTLLADHGAVASEPDVIERLSGRVNDQVHEAGRVLGARVQVDRELAGNAGADSRDGPAPAGAGAVGQWWVLFTVAGGVRRPTGELVAALNGELERGRTELAEEEERLFEQTLAGSVRRALADRIRQANALVDAINVQLDAVRTAAAGVRVRLQWAVDPDQLDAVKAARALLLRDPADLAEGERASLQDFVRARVDQARAELEGNAPWEARLRETLDYRAWHRFTLQIAHRDWEGYQPATPRRLQRLSTGERSMALHLPMIASVAAHYAGDDGRPSGCPRLILLDELFAGVDAANRAQLFGTFSAWDLDAVFTSDHEWCQYATLDGIAIHHLHPGGPDEPVTSTRFTWDGRTRRIEPGAPAA
ncbi:MAG TPA: TIGR02680 family protein, partial [Acidimicrobiales bacterium]|nr:TIGR02680 family protein [Acidimicrobiales bacterium]